MINSNDKNRMNAGYLILGGICEGLCDKMRKDLNKLMNEYIVKGLNHEESIVKGPAIKALC